MDYIAEAPVRREDRVSVAAVHRYPEAVRRGRLVVARGELVYVVLNLYPYNPGHLMVVPYRRVSELEDLTDAESAELMACTQKAIRVIKSVSNPMGFNVGLNLGRCPAARWPNTCTCTWCRGGSATPTSSRSSAVRR